MTRKLPNPPRVGGANMSQKLPPLLDCKPFKVTGLTEDGKPFEPKEGQPGSRISWGLGESGEIWCFASSTGVWVIPDGSPYGTLVLVNRGVEVQTIYYAGSN